MTEEEAQASVQQVVYTLQAYAQQRLPVEFTTADGPADQVLGTTADGPVPAEAPLDALSHVNLTDPRRGAAGLRHACRSRAWPARSRATCLWTLQDDSGAAVDDGFFTAEGLDGRPAVPVLRRDRRVLGRSRAATPSWSRPTTRPAEPRAPAPFSDSRTVVVE